MKTIVGHSEGTPAWPVPSHPDHFSLGFIGSSWSKNAPGCLVPWHCVVNTHGLVRSISTQSSLHPGLGAWELCVICVLEMGHPAPVPEPGLSCDQV